jgi:hypothetical protein
MAAKAAIHDFRSNPWRPEKVVDARLREHDG